MKCTIRCGRKQNITRTMSSIWSASINNNKNSQKTWTSFVCRKLRARTNFWVMMRKERRLRLLWYLLSPNLICFLENKTKTESFHYKSSGVRMEWFLFFSAVFPFWSCLHDPNVFKLSCFFRLCQMWLREGVPPFTVRPLCFLLEPGDKGFTARIFLQCLPVLFFS